MDWKNINLSDAFERSLNIVEPLSFDQLLLEVECNCKTIDRFTIMKQFEESLKAKITCARELMASNMDNLIENALAYRNKDEVRVCMGQMRDTDNMKFEVYQGTQIIGYGHLNIKSNTAHVDMLADWEDMEDDIVEGIEEKTIKIQ